MPLGVGAALAAASAGLVLAAGSPAPQPSAPPVPQPSTGQETASPAAPLALAPEAFGAFLGSGPEGIRRMAAFSRWLDGMELNVGHTYLPGDLWINIQGRPEFLAPWAEWRRARPERLFVLNVPMLERSEAGLPDGQVRRLLRQGAAGRFDRHFRVLAERLVALGLPDTVIVLGWEMNGTTYTHRCAPDPAAWRAYWRRIVAVMRAVPGQRFRFDFTPSRGRDAIPWTRCYPGDDVVDIIGMDSYDQPPGDTFDDHVSQPYGLQDHANFARRHGKPMSFPEWGLFHRGDNPEYISRMLEWIAVHEPLYHTISDYCPHGVWWCGGNPESAEVFRRLVSPARPPAPPSPSAQPPRGPRVDR
ncbi:glycoside hydrolase family 26 protein [Streptomyces aidingensis]|uniref:Glycosyl hydrolase family 26 n=1 Tax=Streptomyces aidingensis TaxID=910347 RepID=A0A1I1QN75_9ACTN|nr:glycosyl hydrolase [Streptomyces aidingensis]SFD23574.1 Glycosyl hydrolase family 26 [Streptomyces aidingensis]